MSDVNVSVLVPVFLPFPREDIDWLVAGTHRQLAGLSKKVCLNRSEMTPVQFRWLARSRTKTVKKKHFQFKHWRVIKLLEVSFNIRHKPSKFTVNDLPEFVYELSVDANLFLRTLSLAANIARPGSFAFDRPVMFVKGEKPVKLRPMVNSLDSIFSFGNKIDWPSIKMLRLIKVWDWLKRIDDVWVAFGKSPSGRALAAFSHLFAENWGRQSPLDDLWAVVGLEAIYNSNGRQRELIEKACLFLGSIPKTKKQIENVYGTRSGLVHGGMNFPFSYCDFDGLPEYEAWMDKAIALKDRSVPILVATLQRMAQEGIYSIDFEYKLKMQRTALC